ncbi:DUF748 domain-containing protein [Bdellovibrio sp. NC01]|uniref:DUF748 domain-containing protein n=1 Tax=Bdellovibrio sp. NC01 TaxID=2220073 RepID=UPI00115AD7B1|nr:DUF748 domain-containing protein [Bdellovibrio sp. NC01]QDK36306.1 hypothetical protein DOE51_01170 [Bdellovibrio sp. NC01]
MKNLLHSLSRVSKTVWIIILLLVGIRILLPYGCKYAINWYLGNKMESYKGHIDDFDLALYRGAYQIQDLKIWKKTLTPKNSFVEVKNIDLSLAWRALFKMKLLGDLEIDGAKIDLVDSDNKKKKQLGKGEEDWKTIVGKLVPIELESFKMTRSELHLINRDFKAPVDVVLDRIEIHATNIKNTDDSKEVLPSTVTASARLMKNAPVHADAKINLISKVPAFEAKLKMDKLDLTKLNDFFLAYGPFTFTSGKFSIYSEVTTKDNKIKGYVKPFFENIDVISDQEHFDSAQRFFNEVGLAMANLILRNRNNKTVATKIEFEGASHGPDVDKWGAVWTSLRNGFVEALRKTLDNTISIKDVERKK